MTYPEDPSQQSPQQPGFPPPPSQGGPAYPPPPSQGGPAYPPPPLQGGPAYPPPQGAPVYPPAPPPQAGPAYPPPPAGAPPYGYGAAVPPGMYFDQESGLTLPAGTQLASAGRRIGAYFLRILLFVVTLVIGYIIWGLIAWSKGRSPAFQVLGMRAWRPATGQTASWGYMALRDVCEVIFGAVGIIALISFIMFLANKERKTLHDMVAGTVVLSDPNKVLQRAA